MFFSYLQALFALAVTVGLIFGAASLARRYLPAGLLAGRSRGERRLELVETLTLGPQHRLVLVRADGRERLVLLGEGSIVPPTESRS